MQKLTEKLTTQQMEREYRAKGYKFFNEPFSLNLFGIRGENLYADEFDDLIGLVYSNGSERVIELYPATTDPGAHYLLSPMNTAGTAILVPGQYRSMYMRGMHRNRPALVQRGKCAVYRDNNRDDRLDFEGKTIQIGHYGINMHRANIIGRTHRVGRYSAGCQVLQNSEDMDKILRAVKLQRYHLGSSVVTYTLFYEPEMLISKMEETC